MVKRRKFVLRTIRGGQVKINGRIFRPSKKWLKYDDRLEGQRWAFGLYWRGDEQLPMVSLWGNEKAYQASMDEELWEGYCVAHDLAPDVVYSEELKSWYYPWTTWYAVGADNET